MKESDKEIPYQMVAACVTSVAVLVNQMRILATEPLTWAQITESVFGVAVLSLALPGVYLAHKIYDKMMNPGQQ